MVSISVCCEAEHRRFRGEQIMKIDRQVPVGVYFLRNIADAAPFAHAIVPR